MAVSIGIAFVAGVLSFFSPCILPLVPGFLAYLAGLDFTGLRAQKGFNTPLFLNTLCYVAGFTLVFSLAGVLLTVVFGSVSGDVRNWLAHVGGVIIILFGLSMLGVLKIPFLDREHKPQVRRKAGYFTSFLFGTAFAVGWTPCFGAVLGGILTLAASTPADAFILLLAYSAGLSLPFLLAGTFYSSVSRFIKVSSRYSRIVSIVLGVLLIIVGLLLFFNQLSMFGLQGVFDTWYIGKEQELLDSAANANLG
jgi:cytochrome c-type biogenesis protein